MGSIEVAPLPIIDFAPWHHPRTQDDQLAVAKSLIDGCRTHSAVYIVNHGVPTTSVTKAFDMAERFYRLSDDVKAQAAHPPGMEVHRGWTKVGGENATNYSIDGVDGMRKAAAIPEKRECFDLSGDEGVGAANLWPPDEALPGFRETIMGFHRDARVVLQAVLEALGLGLGLRDPAYFVNLHPAARNHLRLLHSPAIPAAQLESGVFKRMGAHTDFSPLAVIFQDDCGGLQVANPYKHDGTFIDVTPIEDTCVFMLGQPFERFTNGFLKAVPHRVSIPPRADRFEGPERMTRDRLSLAYFADMVPDTVIEPRPECIDAEHPRQFEPITVGELFQNGYKAIAGEYGP